MARCPSAVVSTSFPGSRTRGPGTPLVFETLSSALVPGFPRGDCYAHVAADDISPPSRRRAAVKAVSPQGPSAARRLDGGERRHTIALVGGAHDNIRRDQDLTVDEALRVPKSRHDRELEFGSRRAANAAAEKGGATPRVGRNGRKPGAAGPILRGSLPLFSRSECLRSVRPAWMGTSPRNRAILRNSGLSTGPAPGLASGPACCFRGSPLLRDRHRCASRLADCREPRNSSKASRTSATRASNPSSNWPSTWSCARRISW